MTVAPAGASPVPRFGAVEHLQALARDPPQWPARTDAASLLALDLEVARTGLGSALGPQRIRLELLDYPGEWLLDLPLLRTGFLQWSEATLRRLEGRPEAAEFLALQAGLPAGAGADEHLAATGHALYRQTLKRLRDAGLSLLQPGRFLMPAPGPAPAWMAFFPHRGQGGLLDLLQHRYAAYCDAVMRDLSDPLFGSVDRLVVLVDLLTALASGPAAFADVQAALAEAAGGLRWERNWLEAAAALGRLRWPPPVLAHVVFAATKADHVGARQRDNLRALLRTVVAPARPVRASYFAMAAVQCTEDVTVMLGDTPVSGVVGRKLGDERMVRSYPGEVPAGAPDAEFWSHRFLRIPDFEPRRPTDGGRGGMPNIGLDHVLTSLLEDVL